MLHKLRENISMFTAWIYISNVEMGSRGYLCVKLLRSKLDTDVASKTGGNYWKKKMKRIWSWCQKQLRELDSS